MGPKTNIAQQYMVLDTSAMIAMLRNFPDPNKHTAPALDLWLNHRDYGHILNHIVIPDHVLYELTGILPISFPTMLSRLKEAGENPEQLHEVVEFYVEASPRGGKRVEGGDAIKEQMRTLLRFVARRLAAGDQEVILPTQVSRKYCEQLKIDHTVFGGVADMDLSHYRPTFGDISDILGERFDIGRIRIHTGQLLMMGFLNEQEYDDRVASKKTDAQGRETEETINSVKQRFIKAKDFTDLLHKKKWISDQERNELNQFADNRKKQLLRAKQEQLKSQGLEEEVRKQRLDKLSQDLDFLTVDLLQSELFTKLFQRYRHSKARDSSQPSAYIEPYLSTVDEIVQHAIKPSRMLVEHYFYGGVIPHHALYHVAKHLNYSVDDQDNEANKRRSLNNQGFFERMLNIQDLQSIYRFLSNDKDGSPLCTEPELVRLKQVIDSMPQAVQLQAKRFKDGCAVPASAIYGKKRRSTANIGVPYEKVFAQELINGTISAQEFVDILRATRQLQLMTDDSREWWSTRDEKIAIDFRQPAEQSIIRINQQGFFSRQGHEELKYPLADYSVRHGENYYLEIPLDKLIDICQTHRAYNGPTDPMDRVFESLMRTAVENEAVRVREIARNTLGDERLIQMEKDFSNRHARQWLEYLPPYANPFASAHVQRRLMRKNLGEISTAEAATTLCEQHPDATVWLINHDSDLFPSAVNVKRGEQNSGTGTIQLSSIAKRTHTDKQEDLQTITDRLEKHSGRALQFVHSEQFLRAADRLLHRQPKPDGPYPHVKMKQYVRCPNGRWEQLVAQVESRHTRA